MGFIVGMLCLKGLVSSVQPGKSMYSYLGGGGWGGLRGASRAKAFIIKHCSSGQSRTHVICTPERQGGSIITTVHHRALHYDPGGSSCFRGT